MFEKILFRQQKKGYQERPIDIGMLVETMLFYGSTHVVANTQMLKELILRLGADNLVRLMEAEILTISYTEHNSAILTNTKDGYQFHDAIIYSSPQHTVDLALRNCCISVIPGTGKARRTARRLEKHVETIELPDFFTDNARQTLLNPGYFPKAARLVLSQLIPTANTDHVSFESSKEPDGIVVKSNLNLAAANEIYHKTVPKNHSSITYGHILDHIQDAEFDVYFASSLSAELATSEISSMLVSEKVKYLIDKRENSETEIDHFQEYVFNNGRSIREAFNDGTISADQVTGTILTASDKFKGWLAGQDPDAKLLAEYIEAITKEGLFDKLPGKSSRFVIFTGAGLLIDAAVTGGMATAIGVGVGALDTFYLDNLLKGWKPNQFIEDEVKPLIKSGDD